MRHLKRFNYQNGLNNELPKVIQRNNKVIVFYNSAFVNTAAWILS